MRPWESSKKACMGGGLGMFGCGCCVNDLGEIVVTV